MTDYLEMLKNQERVFNDYGVGDVGLSSWTRDALAKDYTTSADAYQSMLNNSAKSYGLNNYEAEADALGLDNNKGGIFSDWTTKDWLGAGGLAASVIGDFAKYGIAKDTLGLKEDELQMKKDRVNQNLAQASNVGNALSNMRNQG